MTIDLFFIGSPHKVLARVDRVEIDARPDVVVVTLFLGDRPEAKGLSTLEGRYSGVRVELPSRLGDREIVDGFVLAVARQRLAMWRAHVESTEAGLAEPGLHDEALAARDELQEAMDLGGAAVEDLASQVMDLDARYRRVTVPIQTDEGPWWWEREPAVPDLVPQQAGANTKAGAAYGEEQAADEYGGIYLTTEHPAACVVCFTAHIEQHRQRLMGLVPYPEHLTLRQVLSTARDLEEVREDVSRLMRGSGPCGFGQQLGPEGFVIAVELAQGRDDLADELRRRFGSRVQVDQSL